MDKKLIKKAQKITLFITDVDGVLTDGSIYLGNNGEEFKAFNSQDGQWIKLAQKAGIVFAVITGRKSKIVEKRMKELDITEIYQGVDNKLVVYNKLVKKFKVDSSRVAYIGDDISDLPVMERTGLALSVSNGITLAKNEADYITETPGGKGAVQEIVEIILKAKGVLSDIV